MKKNKKVDIFGNREDKTLDYKNLDKLEKLDHMIHNCYNLNIKNLTYKILDHKILDKRVSTWVNNMKNPVAREPRQMFVLGHFNTQNKYIF